jgi:hypothetical protein
MKKITSILSLAAIVVSALFMSCAKSKTPDVVVAFPSNKYATYERGEDGGFYKWTYASADKYEPWGTGSGAMGSSSPKRGGFEEQYVPNDATINLWFEPNASWTAEVVGEVGKKYIQLGFGPGNQSQNLVKGSKISGGCNNSWVDLQIEVIDVPHISVGDVEVVIELEMGGQRMPLATITIVATETELSVAEAYVTMPAAKYELDADGKYVLDADGKKIYSNYYDLEYTIGNKINNTFLPKITIENGGNWLTATHVEDSSKIRISCTENKAQTEREAVIKLQYPATDPALGPVEVSVLQEAAPVPTTPETPETPGNEGGNTEGGNTGEGGNTEGGNTEGEVTTLVLGTPEGAR